MYFKGRKRQTTTPLRISGAFFCAKIDQKCKPRNEGCQKFLQSYDSNSVSSVVCSSQIPGTGELVGYVTDVISGNPIEGAIVKVGRSDAGTRTYVCSDDGFYWFLLPAKSASVWSSYKFEVEADGYRTFAENIVLREGDRITKSVSMIPVWDGKYVFNRMWPTLPQPWYFDNRVVAIDHNGNVYLTSGKNIQKFTANGNLINRWTDSRERDDDHLNDLQVSSIAVNSSGDVFVVDFQNEYILKFTKDGQFVTEWKPDGQPMSLAVDIADNVWVSVSGGKIQKFTSDGEFVAEWVVEGCSFEDIVVDNDFHLYANCGGDVRKFVLDGELKSEWKEEGIFSGIAIDKYGDIYASDWFEGCVLKFTPDGQFVARWDVGKDAGSELYHNPGNGASGKTEYLYILEETRGNAVTSGSTYRVEKFSTEGSLITRWGAGGNRNEQFWFPNGIDADSDGNVYVADELNHLIKKFTPMGQLVSSWGGYGSSDGKFINPSGIEVDNAGNIYVADSGNCRIQKNSMALFWIFTLIRPAKVDFTGN